MIQLHFNMYSELGGANWLKNENIREKKNWDFKYIYLF